MTQGTDKLHWITVDYLKGQDQIDKFIKSTYQSRSALHNLPLHAIFSHIDLLLQQTPIGETGTNYPYKVLLQRRQICYR
jgi:hypothetical protein